MQVKGQILELLDVNMVIAILMGAATVVVLALLIYFTFFLKKKGNAQEPEKTKPVMGDSFEHCELNEIMGYDFIQIKTPVRTATDIVKDEKPIQKTFEQSQGIGMQERQVSTTGAKEKGYEDEPIPTKEEQQKNREQEKKNEEFERRAEEEQMVETTPEVLSAIIGNTEEWIDSTEWSETDQLLEKRTAFETMMDGIEVKNNELEEVIEEETDSNLEAKPQDRKSYDEINNDLYDKIEHFQEEMSNYQTSEEEDKILSEL